MLTFLVLGGAARAAPGGSVNQQGQGLTAPNIDTVWPSWQARISLQSAAPTDLRLLATTGAQQRAAETLGTASASRGL